MPNEEQGLVLNGLDGSNPLGFLAALGVLRTLALKDVPGDWRMRWRISSGGVWTPVLDGSSKVEKGAFIDLLLSALRRDQTPEFSFSKNLNVTVSKFRQVAEAAKTNASSGNRRFADFVASFGCDAIMANKGSAIQDTALRTMSGAGHQHFLGTMSELVVKIQDSDLQRSLFEKWDYADEKLGLRWDPVEDRRYALRWGNPSGDATRTMRGANRLAIESLPLLPSIPVGRKLQTTGFSRRDRAIMFSWPIWVRSIGLDVTRSLLAYPQMQDSLPDQRVLRSMGVAEVYRSERITVGKFRNLTHAQPTK